MKRRDFLKLSVIAVAAAHVVQPMRGRILAQDVGWFHIPMHVQPAPLMTPTMTLTASPTSTITPTRTPKPQYDTYMPEVHN